MLNYNTLSHNMLVLLLFVAYNGIVVDAVIDAVVVVTIIVEEHQHEHL